MRNTTSQSSESELIDQLMRLVAGLRATPDASALCEQIEQGNAERAGFHNAVERAFLDFASSALQQYARDAKHDPGMRAKAKLLLGRLRASQTETLDPPPLRASGGRLEDQVAALLWANYGRRSSPPPPQPAVNGGTTGSQCGRPALLGINLGRSVDDIDAVRESLARRLSDAAHQSLDLVAHLKTLAFALEQADTPAEVDQLQRILVETTGELVHEHARLDTHLRTAHDHLSALESRIMRVRADIGRINHITLTDPYTGMPNRIAFLRRLEAETARAQRYRSPLAIAIIDPDRLGQITDHTARGAGDAVVRCYASEILGQFRAYDMVARFGEAEFALLMPDAGPEQTLSALRKVQDRAARTYYQYRGRQRTAPTFSSGVAGYSHNETPAELLRRADQALHRAKIHGPNHIECA